MKKKIAVLAAGICALSLILTGCSSEISNDYVTITKYKGVEIDKVDSTKVSDDDVESQINSVLQSKATTTEVTDRAAHNGDTVTIDYEGKKDGVAFDGGTATDAQLTLGSGTFIDGFEDGVVGHNIGDTFDLDLTFPENYGNEELAGQAVVFTVTLKAISQTDVPELTDEFVHTPGRLFLFPARSSVWFLQNRFRLLRYRWLRSPEIPGSIRWRPDTSGSPG